MITVKEIVSGLVPENPIFIFIRKMRKLVINSYESQGCVVIPAPPIEVIFSELLQYTKA